MITKEMTCTWNVFVLIVSARETRARMRGCVSVSMHVTHCIILLKENSKKLGYDEVRSSKSCIEIKIATTSERS